MPKTVCRAVSHEKADERHCRFEEAEDQSDPQSRPGIDAGNADPYRSGEIVEANGECAQHKCEHNHDVSLSTP
jgi:hypothetical protein